MVIDGPENDSGGRFLRSICKISDLNSQQSRFLARLGMSVHVMHITFKNFLQ